MSISSLFSGMEAYLDGDVEINNDTAIPEEDTVVDIERTAEVTSDTADATEEAKDTEVASQMLSRMCDMYDHVKQFGIDRTFVSLYNRHGELDRVCGMRFPSCESMDVVGDRYSRYSTAFIAAMESEKEGLWAKVKNFILKIWEWIVEKAFNLWYKISKLLKRKNIDLQQEAKQLRSKYFTHKRIDLSELDDLTFLCTAESILVIQRKFDDERSKMKAVVDEADALCKAAENYKYASSDLIDTDEFEKAYKGLVDRVNDIKEYTEHYKTVPGAGVKYASTQLDYVILHNAEIIGYNTGILINSGNAHADSAKELATRARKIVSNIRSDSGSHSQELCKSLVNITKAARLIMSVSLTNCNFCNAVLSRVVRGLRSPHLTKQLDLKN